MERFAREQAPERAERTDTLVWGKNAVTELLKSGGAVDTVYLTDTMPQAVAGYYTALAKESGAVVKRVPGNKLQKMCGTPDHQGVAARAAEVEYAALDDLFRAAEARGEQPFLVLCDGVEDPHNLGAIVRSAYLCGAHGVVIPKRGGVGVTGTVMKASAGAAARLPIARVSNLAQAIRTIKEHNMFRAAEARGEQPFLVLCDGVEDPHNLGAIVRSAYLCGAHGVVIPKRGGVGVTGTVMKASAGAAARLPIARVSNLAQAIRTIKEHNIFVYCADLGGVPLAKTDLSGPVALVLGSEGGGPGALTRKLCDAAVTLEMAPGQATGVDSYNVSVAAGILCYDVMRRRLAKK